MALVVTTIAKNYDFFLYYFTLVIASLMLLSGVSFPLDTMPSWIQSAAHALPLSHAVNIARPLMMGTPIDNAWLHIGVIMVYGVTANIAMVLMRRCILA